MRAPLQDATSPGVRRTLSRTTCPGRDSWCRADQPESAAVLNIGFPEMFVVGVLALVVFGPERLPELARNAAKFIAKFRTEASKSIADLKAAADLGDLEDEFRSIKGDLTSARDEIQTSLREPSDQLKGIHKEVSEGGPMGRTPEPAGPPPMDPEAT